MSKHSILSEFKFFYIGAGMAVLLLMGGLFVYNKSIPNRQTFDGLEFNKEKDEIESKIRRVTDGVLITKEEQPDKFFAVMIENSAEAWPLSGLSKARLVFEAPVEGSIPRFMAIFDNKQEVDSIGPVRSARPYYVEWAAGLKAMYTHVGGSPDGLSLIKKLGIPSLNQFYFSQFFERISSRYAPHNVYTSVEKLTQGWDEKTYEIQTFPNFEYKESDKHEGDQKITIPFSSITDLYKAVWVFDQEHQNYVRYQNDEQQFDADNSEVRAVNVVVMKTEIKIVDEIGRRFIKTMGRGKALLFQNGQQFEIEWEKESSEGQLNFIGAGGEKVYLLPGSTWIEVISLSTEVKVEP